MNQVDSGYFANNRIEIQQLINKNSKKILDVGCGAGAMANEVKRKLNAETWGIELIEPAGKAASEKLDKVFIGKVEEEYIKLPDNYFDSIIFADVLEHLIDPYNLLANIKSKLKDSGEIIASIPNINYWGLIQCLLMGDFTYQDNGILDRTHLRFFTKKTITDMFENAGFYIVEIIPTRSNAGVVPDNFLKVCKELGFNDEKIKEEGNVFQYLVKAVKKELYSDVLKHLLNGEKYMTAENYSSAYTSFKVVAENIRKYGHKELCGVKIDLIEEIIKKLYKII